MIRRKVFENEIKQKIMNRIIRLRIFRAIAGFMAFYHLVFGIIVVFLGEQGTRMAAQILYGVDLATTPEILYLAKFIAAYGFSFGVMMAILALWPERYRYLVWAAVALVVVRVFERLVFFDLLNEAFDITMAQNMVTITTISTFAAGLIFFMPKDSQAKQIPGRKEGE